VKVGDLVMSQFGRHQIGIICRQLDPQQDDKTVYFEVFFSETGIRLVYEEQFLEVISEAG